MGEYVTEQVKASLKPYYKSELWSREIPRLANVLEDEPSAPKYIVVKNNAICQSGKITLYEQAKDYVDAEGIFENETADFADYAGKNFRIPTDSEIYKEHNFDFIPMEKSGLKDEKRSLGKVISLCLNSFGNLQKTV